MNIKELIHKENWKIQKDGSRYSILAFGQQFEIAHPVQIYLKLYREEEDPDKKLFYMKKVYFYLWPEKEKTWNYWTERRFYHHCKGWNYITYAGGASTAKSHDAAVIALIFWLANPRKRTVVVASTTLESLSSRIWGYVTKLLETMAVPLPAVYTGGNTPKILFPTEKSGSGYVKDTIHGMFAIAAKSGDTSKSISSWIGRHPEEALMVILDESTDINPAIKDAFINLEAGGKPFQLYGIGNSLSIYDLHGAMSTPKDPRGWDSIDPSKDFVWETTQRNGVCLFFSCFDSPAIFENDPEKKKLLSKFLITQEQINDKRLFYGEDSEGFWRFVIGFWKTSSADSIVISEEFLKEGGVERSTEWSGFYPINFVAGLDPAFSTGGDDCILRLAVLGIDTNGQYALDFRGDSLVFKIDIKRSMNESADIQIAKKVKEILDKYKIPLRRLAVDASGQGRSIGEVIKLYMQELTPPIKVYSTGLPANKNGKGKLAGFDITVKSSYELWFGLRAFVQSKQIRGVDPRTLQQLSSRLVLTKNGKQALETKVEYKKRMGAVSPILAVSPDYADSAALCVESAIQNFGFSPGNVISVPSQLGGRLSEKMQAHLHKEREAERQELIKNKKGPSLPPMRFKPVFRSYSPLK